jgi:dolichyl-diphosphooligosaccharide--protein glycosyltransferase
MAKQMSGPQLMFKATDNNGKAIIVDDYRECYRWMKEKTPQDARILAWWARAGVGLGLGVATHPRLVGPRLPAHLSLKPRP